MPSPTFVRLRASLFAAPVAMLLATLFGGGFAIVPGQAAPPAARRWVAEPDGVYLQEVNGTLPTEQPIDQVAVLAAPGGGDRVHAVIAGRLHRLSGDGLEPVAQAPADIRVLVTIAPADGGARQLWASGPQGTFRLADDGSWTPFGTAEMVGFCWHAGAVHAATRDAVFRLEDGGWVDIKPADGYLSSDSTVVMEDYSQVLADPVRIGPIQRIASYSGTLYLLGPHRLALLDGPTFVPDPIDWGTLPGTRARDLLVRGSRLHVTTDRGLATLRGMAIDVLDGTTGFPLEDTTCLADGFADDLWVGTTTGAIRCVGDHYHYFGADHWLPGDGVRSIAVGDQRVYVATDRGLGIITYRPYTLRKKADYYERQLDAWGHRRLGFVHKLYRNEADGQWLREISDNDGGHTAHYLAAMSYKFAVTGDPVDRQRAADAFQAMAWLESITPSPGFIARAVWSPRADRGRRSERGSGGLPAKWYDSADGLWQWKGDTSSDEVSGHIYAVSLFHDLAADEPLKRRAAAHVGAIASHIVDNGWVLRDMDGKPTRWGRWDPDYLLRPYGHDSRGLNGLEAQSYMWAALALTGDQKFRRALDQLIAWRYHTFTVRQKHAFPPDVIVPWDDELAYRALSPTLRYADDEFLRSIYLRNLERSHEMMRFQKRPHFNFVYGAATGNDCEQAASLAHLREWSLDLVDHRYRNSHRRDLATEPGYRVYTIGTRAISPRESEAKWGSRSAIDYDGGSGRTVTPAIGWLEDYWMGRYYGFILPPDTDDPELVAVRDGEVPVGGAAPYAGPPRPANP